MGVELIDGTCPNLIRGSAVPDNAAIECAVNAVCDIVKYCRNKAELIGFSLGFLYIIVSICMYFACWSACCCKSLFIDDEVHFSGPVIAAPQPKVVEQIHYAQPQIMMQPIHFTQNNSFGMPVHYVHEQYPM